MAQLYRIFRSSSICATCAAAACLLYFCALPCNLPHVIIVIVMHIKYFTSMFHYNSIQFHAAVVVLLMSLRHNRRRPCSNTTIAYCSFNLRYIDKMHIGRLSLRSAAACCHMATKLLHGAAEEITSGLGLKFCWKFVSRTVAADKQNSRQLCKQNVSVLLPASMRLFHLISARSNILLPGSVLATLLPAGLDKIF